jgi:hypothetical protein
MSNCWKLLPSAALATVLVAMGTVRAALAIHWQMQTQQRREVTSKPLSPSIARSRKRGMLVLKSGSDTYTRLAPA